MKAERFELWSAVNSRTGCAVYRLIRAECITPETPITDLFERDLEPPEKSGSVDITEVEGATALADCYKEE